MPRFTKPRFLAHPRTRHILDAAFGVPIIAGWFWLVLAYFGVL